MLDSGPRLGDSEKLERHRRIEIRTRELGPLRSSLTASPCRRPRVRPLQAPRVMPMRVHAEPMVLSVSTTCRRSAIVRSRSAARFRMAASACSVKSWVQGELSDSNLAVLGWESQPAGNSRASVLAWTPNSEAKSATDSPSKYEPHTQAVSGSRRCASDDGAALARSHFEAGTIDNLHSAPAIIDKTSLLQAINGCLLIHCGK